MKTTRRVLLTGATGFVGRELLPRLLEGGHHVRAMSRRQPSQLDLGPAHGPGLEIVSGDAMDRASLEAALEGIDTVVYLSHSMEGGLEAAGAYVERDHQAALNMAQAARACGVEHIVYLGGLVPEEHASAHLASRQRVEHDLASTGCEVTTLRAGLIIGRASAGVQLMRELVGRQRVLMIPPEMRSACQPAYIGDVVEAIGACVERSCLRRGIFELGSREITTYRDLVEMHAEFRGVAVEFIDVPWAPRELTAVYIAALSGLSYALVEALSQGWGTDMLTQDDTLYRLAPDLQRATPREAMREVSLR